MTNALDPDTYRTPDAYPLSVGDRVYDIKNLCDESVTQPEAAIVVDVFSSTVHEHTYTQSTHLGPKQQAINQCDNNVRYADFDVSERVVAIAWTSWLDAYAGDWVEYRDAPEDLMAYLDRLVSQWGIPVPSNTYDYPESRLTNPQYLG